MLVLVNLASGLLCYLHDLLTVLVAQLHLVLIQLHSTTFLVFSVLIYLVLTLCVLIFNRIQLLFQLLDFFSFEFHQRIKPLLGQSRFFFFFSIDLRFPQKASIKFSSCRIKVATSLTVRILLLRNEKILSLDCSVIASDRRHASKWIFFVRLAAAEKYSEA